MLSISVMINFILRDAEIELNYNVSTTAYRNKRSVKSTRKCIIKSKNVYVQWSNSDQLPKGTHRIIKNPMNGFYRLLIPAVIRRILVSSVFEPFEKEISEILRGMIMIMIIIIIVIVQILPTTAYMTTRFCLPRLTTPSKKSRWPAEKRAYDQRVNSWLNCLQR